jgi:hypothetical protein
MRLTSASPLGGRCAAGRTSKVRYLRQTLSPEPVPESPVPPRVAQFIAERIDSVMQLETLLLIASQRHVLWTASMLAQEWRVDPAWLEAQLRSMTSAGLLETAGGDAGGGGGQDAQFRYAPRTQDLAGTVDDLARAYADRRVTVIGMIFSTPLDKIRSFADAFRFRKDKPE